MENKNLLTLAITLTVGIILAGSLLMPVISDATETERTFINEGYFNMSEITADSDITIVWDSSTPTIFTINDEDYTVTPPLNKPVTVVGADNMIIRYTHPNATYYAVQTYSGQGYAAATTSDSTTMTITISGFTVTAAVGTTTKTVTATEGYFIDPNGAKVMKAADSSAYLHKTDNVIVLAGITNITGAGDTGIYATGTIDGGLEYTYVQTSASTPTVTFGDATFNYTDVSGYNELVSLTKCTFDVTNNGSSATAEYTYFLVPVKVTAELSNHLSSGEIAIMNALPLLIIVALVVMAAGALYLKRDD